MKATDVLLVSVCFSLVVTVLTAGETGKNQAQPNDFSSATSQAEEDMKSEAVLSYFSKIGKDLGDQLEPPMKKCANLADNRSKLDLQIVLRIAGDGRVDAVFPKGTTALETCLKEKLTEVRLSVPPKAPLHLSLNLNAHH